jgi:hypothetical protein
MDEPKPHDLRRSVDLVADTLLPHADADWSAPAGDLEWTCRRTLNHLIDVLLFYAGHLSRLAPERRGHVRDGDEKGSIERLLEALVSSGHILARVVEATPAGGRAYHSFGLADGSGFVAMACDESLVHANDIASGLGVVLQPPEGICERVTARLFPWAPEHDDAWARLLWCNGRTALPDHDRLGPEWGWWCAPLAEWDGVAYTDHGPGS